jgi:hypothetical protein
MAAKKVKKEFNSKVAAPGSYAYAHLSLFQATQTKFGFREIKLKQETFRKLYASGGRKKMEAFLQQNPVLVVLGPADIDAVYPFPRLTHVAAQIRQWEKTQSAKSDTPKKITDMPPADADETKGFFVIDHHHHSLALLMSGFETAPFKVIHDFSNLTSLEFLNKMQSLHLLYHNASNGQPGSFNDPYRSLAWSARKAGGYNKVQIPYAEFHWADFLRTRINEKLLNENYDEAVKQALALAKSPEAKELPGYIPPAQIASFAAAKPDNKTSKKKSAKATKTFKPPRSA